MGKERHRAVRAHSTGVLSDSWGKESNVSVGEERVLSTCKGPVAGLGETNRHELRQRRLEGSTGSAYCTEDLLTTVSSSLG